MGIVTPMEVLAMFWLWLFTVIMGTLIYCAIRLRYEIKHQQ